MLKIKSLTDYAFLILHLFYSKIYRETTNTKDIPKNHIETYYHIYIWNLLKYTVRKYIQLEKDFNWNYPIIRQQCFY